MRIAEKSKLLEFYHSLAIAYGRIFDPKSPFTDTILRDLEAFCCAEDTTYSPNRSDRELFILEGRRQVWLRMKEFRTMNAEQLLNKYTRPAPDQK